MKHAQRARICTDQGSGSAWSGHSVSRPPATTSGTEQTNTASSGGASSARALPHSTVSSPARIARPESGRPSTPWARRIWARPSNIANAVVTGLPAFRVPSRQRDGTLAGNDTLTMCNCW